MSAEDEQCPKQELLALFAKLPPGPFWWEQCYELDGMNWAICDATNKAEGRVTSGYMVLHADYDKCYDGQPLSEQDLPKAVIESLNAVPGLIQEIAALTARVAELEGRLADIDAAANADAADLAEMRDGTKLTRAGLVQVIQYQQQDIKELEGERERLRRAFVEMENHTDGHSWYWLSYGEKCYAFAVAAAFPFNEQDEYPPAGTYLTPHETDEQLWVAENGVEMMTDESIASIERQNGDVICKFIAQAYAFAAALAPPEPQPPSHTASEGSND
jgi:hypothetical protein